VKYSYKARTKEGKIETGTIEAYSKEAAALLLQKYNVFVTSLEEEQEKESLFKKVGLVKKVPKKDLTIFFRQLSVMLQSRVPVVQSLVSLASQNRNPYFRDVITKISNLVQEGLPLSEALNYYPNIFNNLYISLLRSGEASGNIAGSLQYISQNLERENDVAFQLRQAMIYPLFVVCILLSVLTIIVVEVMPRITELIKESNANPPFFTILILNFYSFLQQYWMFLILGIIFVIMMILFYFTTKEGRKSYDSFSLKIPFLGEILKKIFIARFCTNIATLITSGVSINKALEITQDTMNNSLYKEIIYQIKKEVSQGEKISSVLSKYQSYFPSFVVQMIKVGEDTGKLDKTLLEVVNFYNKETREMIDLFAKLLEPIMIIFLGIVVASLAISVLSPLYGALGSL